MLDCLDLSPTGPASRQSRPDGATEMARLLDEPPVLRPGVLRGDTRLTQRWAHGGLNHDYMRGIAGHIAVGCYRGNHPISWRIEKKRLGSRTSPCSAFTLIPEGHDGYWEIGGPVVVSHVYLTQERLQACADSVAGGKRVEMLARVAFEDPTTASLLEILSRESVQESASARLFVEQAIDLLCTRLVLGHSALDALPAPAARRGLADWQVKRVTSFMRDNLARPIGLDDLANLVNLSRYHFCTAFRRATGRTPHQWLTMQRIDRARELLANPALSVTDIALSVGYETPSAFAASFRKVAGVSPSHFRRQL
jgi:AraC family transcriptional regulator